MRASSSSLWRVSALFSVGFSVVCSRRCLARVCMCLVDVLMALSSSDAMLRTTSERVSLMLSWPTLSKLCPSSQTSVRPSSSRPTPDLTLSLKTYG